MKTGTESGASRKFIQFTYERLGNVNGRWSIHCRDGQLKCRDINVTAKQWASDIRSQISNQSICDVDASKETKGKFEWQQNTSSWTMNGLYGGDRKRVFCTRIPRELINFHLPSLSHFKRSQGERCLVEIFMLFQGNKPIEGGLRCLRHLLELFCWIRKSVFS